MVFNHRGHGEEKLGEVYVCGSLLYVEAYKPETRRTLVASVDLKNGKLTDWNPVISVWAIEGWYSSVLAIAIYGDVVFVGGEFFTVSGSNRVNVAAIDRTTGLATPWTAN